MLGTNILMPFIAMAAGALFGMRLGGENGWIWGAAIGFGVGCAILALIWLLFAMLRRWAE
jgi:hypothetical protein